MVERSAGDAADGDHEHREGAGTSGTTDDPSGGDADEKPDGPPAFLRYGVYTVGIYLVAVSVLVWGTRVPVEGPSLVAFTVGFLVFMTVYFAAMWAGWLYF